MPKHKLLFHKRNLAWALTIISLLFLAPPAPAAEDFDFSDSEVDIASWDHSYVDPLPLDEILARDKSIPLPEVLRKLSQPKPYYIPDEDQESYRVIGGDMDLPLNEWVRDFLGYYTVSSSKTFKYLHKRSGMYEDLIMSELRKRGMPRELIYLCAVESAFNPRAVSPMAAGGLWQFIPSTGRRYGLDRTYWVDERFDPEKATRAAFAYLSDLYTMFGDWHLAMASYNCGEGFVEKKLRRTGCGDYWCLLAEEELPGETRRYVPNILALAIIGNNPERYGFDNLKKLPSLNYSTVTVDDATDLRTVALCAGTGKDEIERLNPSLLRFCTPPGLRGFKVNIPWGRAEQFSRAYARLSPDEKFAFKRHKVEKGQNLYCIAAGYGTSEKLLASVNNVSTGSALREGQYINVPVPKDTRFDPSRRTPASIPDYQKTPPGGYERREVRPVEKGEKKGGSPRNQPKKFVYKVDPGDTLWVIATANNCSVEDLKKWNPGIDEDTIYPGDEIIIYKRGSQGSTGRDYGETPKKAKTHTVKKGETCGHIAIKYGITTGDLITWNRLDKTCSIREGQTLSVSRPRSSSASASSSGGHKPEGYRGKSIRYTVKAGESLWTIAKKHDVRVSEIVAWNGLDSETVRQGQVLVIKPGPGYYNSGAAPVIAETSPSSTKGKSGKGTYTVKEGDSLWAIAKNQGVSVRDLMAWNNLNEDSQIRPGQKLTVSKNRSTAAETAPKIETKSTSAGQETGPRGKAVTYTVKEGDSLWGIAKKHDVYAWEIKQDNNMSSDNVRPGQKLKIRPGPGYKKGN